MTQDAADLSTPTGSPTFGADVYPKLAAQLRDLSSLFQGTSRPAWFQGQEYWVERSGNVHVIKYYDGTTSTDIEIIGFNRATGESDAIRVNQPVTANMQAQIGAILGAMDKEAVGSVILARKSGGDANWGDLVPGTQLSPANAEGEETGTPLSGTYMLLGNLNTVNTLQRTSLFKKVLA